MMATILAYATVALLAMPVIGLAVCFLACKECEKERKERAIKIKNDVALWLAREKAKAAPIFFFVTRRQGK